MPADELQVAIDRAEQKRRELEATQQPLARESAKILPMLTKAATLYRRQITAGLDGNAREALKARVILRDLLGKVSLEPEKDGACGRLPACSPPRSCGGPQEQGIGVTGFEPATYTSRT